MSLDRRRNHTPEEALKFDPKQRGLADILGGYFEVVAQLTNSQTPEAAIEQIKIHLDALTLNPRSSLRTVQLAQLISERLSGRPPIATTTLLGDPKIVSYERFRMDARQCLIYTPHEGNGETPIQLSPLQGKLALVLIANGGRLIPPNNLIEFAWGNRDDADANTLKTHISGLRKKISDHGVHIINRPGLGYRILDNRDC